jgi:hypothetical protein
MNAKTNEPLPSPREGTEPTGAQDLLARDDLSRDEKVELLHQWELDLREHMVAEEENMPATEPAAVNLDEVLDALRALGAESRFHGVSTKHG